MTDLMQLVPEQFCLDGRAVSCCRYGCGHIHDTYLVQTDTGRRYILQRIGTHAFPDVSGLQRNIAAVTAWLRSKAADPDTVMTLVPTREGGSWYHSDTGEDWRVFRYIENSICLQSPRCAEDLRQSAVAFGSFQQQLADFPAHTLVETIQDFHNTPVRYQKLRRAIEADPLGRAAGVQPEIDFALAREAVCSRLTAMLRSGELPLRVTHNDTKLNNVLLSADTYEPLCVIDLDTTMPGLSAYDFGDSIRFGAATAAEDDPIPEHMGLDLNLYEVFTRGFLEACPGLTPAERAALPLGALTMTMECGVRFLTDYLEGDRYFGITHPEHNLHRCRTQFRLTADMEAKWDDMTRIIRDLERS